MSDIALTVTEQVVGLTETGGTTVEIAITETPIALTVAAGATDHGQLEGLEDDDHKQYLLRTDYVPGGDADTLEGHTASYFEVAGAASSAIGAHVAAANPHTQYLLIADYNPGGTPGGSAGQVQYYGSGGVFAGHSGFTYDGAGVVAVSTALVSPDIRPASNSTNATGFSDSNGTRILAVDATGKTVRILGVASPTNGTASEKLLLENVGSNSKISISHVYQPAVSTDLWRFSCVSDVPSGNANMTLSFGNKNGAAGFLLDAGLQFTTSGAVINQYSTYTAFILPQTKPLIIQQAAAVGNYFEFNINNGFIVKTQYGAKAIFSVNQSVGVFVESSTTTTTAVDIKSVSGQTASLIRVKNSANTEMFAIGANGEIRTNQAVANTNTPSGATLKAVPLYNASGTLDGYIPVYAIPW